MQVLAAQRNTIFKATIRMAGAAVVAGLIVFLTAGVPKANDVNGVLPQDSAKGDQLAIAAKGTACSLHGWPYFERTCQFDLRKSDNQARKVRVLALR